MHFCQIPSIIPLSLELPFPSSFLFFSFLFHQGLSLTLELLPMCPLFTWLLETRSQVGSITTALFGKSRLWWFALEFPKLHAVHEIEFFKLSVVSMGSLDFRIREKTTPNLLLLLWLGHQHCLFIVLEMNGMHAVLPHIPVGEEAVKEELQGCRLIQSHTES